MMQMIKTVLLGFALLIVFVFMTFPFQRLGPAVRAMVEKGLREGLGLASHCSLESFDFSLFSGFQISSLVCRDISDQNIFELQNVSASVFPGRQVIDASIEKGRIHLKVNAGLKSAPTYVSMELKAVPLAKISPLLGQVLGRLNPMIPRQVKLEGGLNAKVDFPLANFAKASGGIDLKIDALKLPAQSLLDLIGLKEIVFTKATLKTSLQAGALKFSDSAFLSDPVSGKMEGEIQLQDNLNQSNPNLLVRWKVQKSDALMSAPLGQALASAPCPSPDSEGFCTKRVTRMSELAL